MEPIRDNEDFKEAVRIINNSQKKQPNKAKTRQKMIIKRDSSLYALFSRLWERLNVFWTLFISGYLMEPIRENQNFKTLR